MQKLHFSIQINTPKEKVWHMMLDDKPYREWTTAFSPGSYYKGDWKKGSKILFLGPDPKTGEESGMVSRIAENKPYEYISIEHLGLFQNGVEDITSEEAKKWAPAFENYTFKDKDLSAGSGQAVTEVLVDMDSTDEMAEEFKKMWPEALKKLKKIAERK
ncbi:ATPase [Candidatus Roizmanbacteria bacterium RIFCSPLOWO2_01_FULL_37_12]|uniref:ATPase n=1 Tax=Candidatus Roizmanbacteria bacterium RIFCSPLOWO2_01_FULL_37_12 TaxID=1802056 RepID=A0A1F7IAV4_9BACT|nr:MAG: ATPase [Candidatus Roizmanbacteria bacterium RIFCSPHIGHO2_01_FULL_37_16]OGK25209.1 MAG: ATPase [Candidatus Roizmanbacteria bacterium RIFCSPHIGHO2_02_FULL_37_9b]OGK40489.1 MAG: ATPase [Candidatus Roizmanbacteria bacterium RIFCSPLOWO2_01_FULL_37_12]